MKKLSIFAALLALMMVGCAENQLDNIEANESAVVEPTDLTAGFADEEQTKTYVENGKYLRWHEADLITAFFGNTLNRQYKFKGKTGDNSGTFKLVPDGELGTGNDLEAIYALYPYNEDATISDEGVMNITLPATQSYAEDSFGKGANTMIAVTAGVEDTFLGFKNVCGYLKLKLYNESGATLKSVEVKGNNGEKIAGSATAAMEFGGVPTLTMGADATTSVTLDCGEGVVLGTSAEEATELWIVLPETTFEGGITITATDTEGITFEKSTTKPVAITRNEIQPMATLGAEFVVPVPETWKIYYTATEKVTPNKTDVFGANIVSNEWDETTGNGVIIFDGEVTSIGYSAFYRCSSLESITIPEGVTSIGDRAFYICSSLAEFNGKFASEDGRCLIIDGVLNSFAPYGLTEYSIPEGVTSIGMRAFYFCKSLASITIPEGVTSIGKYAFLSCSSLMEFNGKFASEDGRCLIIDGVLNSFAPYGLTVYSIPDGVTSIGDSAFYDCSSLESITIPEGVTSIGGEAFYSCTSLASITIPEGVTSIGESVFYWCSSLASITIPEDVTSIGDRAFALCSSLESITIPEGVTSIGKRAFYNCTSLAEVYCKATTPPMVGDNMFDNNASERKIYVPAESVEAYKTATYWSNYAEYIIAYDFEKGEVVVPIPETWKIYYTATAKVTPNTTDAFGAKIVSNEWNSLTLEGVITFDGEVTSIGYNAFRACSSLVSITIPDSVTSIGENAFYNCSSLASVTIPDSVTSIGNKAFYYCSSLAEFRGKFASEDGRCLIIDGVINSFAIGCGLTEYTIPDSVTSIGDRAFWGCTSLTSITIPDSVTSIGASAFSNCSSLASITIPDSVTSIGEWAFYSCRSLTGITIPDSVTSIGYQAFNACSSLASVTIGNSVTSIGYTAFYDCSSLAEVYCKPTTPPAGDSFMFKDNASERKIYVPAESVEAYKTATYWSNYADDIIAYDFEKGEVVVPTPKPNPENCKVVITYLAPSDEMEFYDWLNDLDAFAYDVSRMGGGASYSSRPSTDYETFTIGFDYELTTITFMKDFHTYPFTSYETNATLTLPASVTSIVVESGATRIFESLYIKATTPPALNNGNHPWGLGSEIYVPAESVDAYKNAEGWRDYADAIEGYDFE